MFLDCFVIVNVDIIPVPPSHCRLECKARAPPTHISSPYSLIVVSLDRPRGSSTKPWRVFSTTLFLRKGKKMPNMSDRTGGTPLTTRNSCAHACSCLRRTSLSCIHFDLIVSLTPLEPQSCFGDKPPKFQVVCPQNGTAVLEGLSILHSRGIGACPVTTESIYRQVYNVRISPKEQVNSVIFPCQTSRFVYVQVRPKHMHIARDLYPGWCIHVCGAFTVRYDEVHTVVHLFPKIYQC